MALSRKLRFAIVIAVTAARIPFAIVFALVFLLAGPDRLNTLLYNIPFAELCIALLILGELTDFFDGMLARKLDVVSEGGAMLDPYADSISRIVIYWALAYSGLIYAVVPIVMAFRDITVGYSRIIFGKTGKSVSAKWSGKIKAVIQGYGCVVILLQPYYWHWGIPKWSLHVFSWIIIIVTLWSMIAYTKEALKEVGKLG